MLPINEKIFLQNMPDCVLGLIINELKLNTTSQIEMLMSNPKGELKGENALKNLSNTCFQFKRLVSLNKLTCQQAQLHRLPQVMRKIVALLETMDAYDKYYFHAIKAFVIYYMSSFIPIILLNKYLNRSKSDQRIASCINLIVFFCLYWLLVVICW